MRYFENKLNAILEETSLPGYINPDDVLNHGIDGISFIYGPPVNGASEVLLAGDNLHFNIMEDNRNSIIEYLNSIGAGTKKLTRLLQNVDDYDDFSQTGMDIRQTLESLMIFGRSGLLSLQSLPPRFKAISKLLNTQQCFVVSIWTQNDGLYKYLDGCVKAVLGYAPSPNDSAPTIVSTPYGTSYANEMKQPERELSDEELAQLEQYRQLHLMNPQDKKRAMQQLGLSPGSEKHPAQKELEKAGIVHPGQKWWAMQSESK